jgi:3-hydroxyacyl-[acyl-carrier-protein] dehydratase
MIRPVQEVLPHREPFSFLDAVESMDDEGVVATYAVPEDADFLRGHYPGNPIVPGVLLVEMALQAGAYFMASRPGVDLAGRVPVVSRLGDVKFKRPVRPGDVVRIEARPEEQIGPAHRMSARLRCDGKIVCMLDYTVLLAEAGA